MKKLLIATSLLFLVLTIAYQLFISPVPQEKIRKVEEYVGSESHKAALKSIANGATTIYGEFCDYDSVLDNGLRSGMNQAEIRRENWNNLSILQKFEYRLNH